VSSKARALEGQSVRLSGNTVQSVSGTNAARRISINPRRGRKRRVLIRSALVCADLLAFAVAMALTSRPSWKTLVVLILILGLFHAGGLFRPRLSLSVLDDVPDILGRSLAAGALAMVLGGLNDGRAGIARLVTCALFGVLCILSRSAAYALIRELRRRGRLRQRTLILGAGSVSGLLAQNLEAHPEYGLAPKGMLDDDPLLSEDERPVPLLGGYAALTDAVLERRVDLVIVTFGSLRAHQIVPLLRACDRLVCEILFVPRLFEVHTVTKDTEVLWGMPVVRMRRAPFRTRAWSGKRVFDAVLSGLLLLLLSPVLLLCMLGSFWETRCVLFRQTRVGLDGQPFTLLKFCSLKPAGDEATTHWNIGDDARVGPIGKLLRRTSLDELPQLWNVVRGDMSLVGPRPERPYFVSEFAGQYPWYMARHRVPVGLTGWAQVHGLRGDTSISDRARFDNFYIENWSMWGDVKILLRTAAQVLRAAGR
jgi:exopolysaccharide biosynthesis polyprenyl glycosylphosphotransferase